ncbi:T9SS type A sorting domain-containing protein [Crocinitomix algicola]|uniref:T9SS type A sorting domain-containing protein n=1 Tax=Crocinitomix algicola TaxID=1740263 RepID=UPI00087312BE|nr:PA domain-containing protein [Crocinitomix algicola]
MKKVVLIMGLCLLAFTGNAQVIFYVQAPSPNEGNYEFTYADDEATDWNVPDMDDPINAIESEMVLIDDDSGLDNPIGCDEVVNDLTGKIAVLYRGTCEFGTKALNAQNAGAIGCIIINNLGGAPVAMGGGDDGLDVTIPVVMITNIDGALLRDEILAGETSVFIGSKNGYYTNDIGFTAADHLRAESFGVLSQLAQDDTEFEVEMGSWVRNYGSNDQTGIVLSATVTLAGSELYNESSDPLSLDAGDSIYVPLPTFSQGSYANGYYNVEYSVDSDATDESDYDNVNNADFYINDEYFSMAALDESTMIPVNSTNQFNGTTDNLYSCLFFQDENASRIGVQGMNFSAGTSQNPDPTSLDGQYFEVYVYEWNDVWVDLDDPDFNILDIQEIADGEYTYLDNLQSENVYIPFEEPVLLEDNQKYLFCVQLYGDDIYPGYDTKTDYNWNSETYRMPTSPLYLSSQWYALGYGTDRNPSVSIKVFNENELSVVEVPEVELVSFPNPATEKVNIPMNPVEGNIHMTIVDVNGKVVSNQDVTMNGSRLEVDVTSFAAGMYVINLEFENGERGSLNIMVSK